MCRLSRSETFDPDHVGVYHVFNRTVRRSYLHGLDPLTGVDYSYRRKDFRDRLRRLSQFFCIDVFAYAVMSNHWHCVLRNRPDQVRALSDREVAVRWLSVTSRKRCQHKQGGAIRECEIAQIVNDPMRVAELRSRLSSLSWFVRLLCQTIARQCNLEDECSGRFFEERFKMNRLEDDADVLACMAYVDLNPLRAGMADSLDGYEEVSIGERMRALDDGLPDTTLWLTPVDPVSEAERPSAEPVASEGVEPEQPSAQPPSQVLDCLPITLTAYASLLWHLALESRPELQARDALTREQLEAPVWRDGTPVNLAELEARHRRYGRRCSAQLGQHACRAIRARLAAQRSQQSNRPAKDPAPPRPAGAD
jgi:REP element-mobilizing transposase RayT